MVKAVEKSMVWGSQGCGDASSYVGLQVCPQYGNIQYLKFVLSSMVCCKHVCGAHCYGSVRLICGDSGMIAPRVWGWQRVGYPRL